MFRLAGKVLKMPYTYMFFTSDNDLFAAIFMNAILILGRNHQDTWQKSSKCVFTLSLWHRHLKSDPRQHPVRSNVKKRTPAICTSFTSQQFHEILIRYVPYYFMGGNLKMNIHRQKIFNDKNVNNHYICSWLLSKVQIWQYIYKY